jgi:AcrR family transcriptional regulator
MSARSHRPARPPRADSGPDERLVEAGRRTLRKFGYQGATVERIATEAGVSRVTLHRRGVTRQTILGTLTARAVDDYRARMWPALTGCGSARERMEAALEALCEAAEANLELLIALRSQADRVFHEGGEEVMTQRVFTDPLERLLRDGTADGSLRAVDARETATVLFNLVGWTYVHMRTGHGWPPERAAQGVLDIALNGLAPSS